MIQIQSILRNNVAGKLLNHCIVFLINVLIVRSLGASQSGTYFNELYLLNFFVFLFSIGLDYSVIYLVAQEPRLAERLKKIVLTISLVFFFLLLLFIWWVMPVMKINSIQPASALLLFSMGNFLLILYQGYLSAHKKFNLQNYLLIVTNLLFLLWLYYFQPVNETGILSRLASGYAILYFVQGILFLLFSIPVGSGGPVNVATGIVLKHGIFIMLSSAIYFAFLRVDNFFVQKYCDPLTLGNYVQCGKVGQYFLYFSSIISSTLLPFIAGETVGASYKEWMKMMKPYLLLLASAAILIVLTGKYLFPWFFGPGFNEMYQYMLLLLPGYLCLGMLTLINAVYIGKGNIKRIFVGDVAGLILVTTLDILLVPKFGAVGAAWISSIAYALVFLYLMIGLKKQFQLSAKVSPVVQL